VTGSLAGLRKPAKGMPNLSTSGGAGSTDWLDDVREQLPATKAAGYFPTGVFGPCARQLIDRTNELLGAGQSALLACDEMGHSTPATRRDEPRVASKGASGARFGTGGGAPGAKCFAFVG